MADTRPVRYARLAYDACVNRRRPPLRSLRRRVINSVAFICLSLLWARSVAGEPVIVRVAPSASDASTVAPCGLTDQLPCSTVPAAVAVASQSVYDGIEVQVHIAAGWYGADSCNVTVDRPLAIVGESTASTVIDCGWSSRFLYVASTAASPFGLYNLTLQHCSSFNNGLEPGGDVNGGAVLVQWSFGGAGLVANFVGLAVEHSLAVFNRSAGHIAGGEQVLGGAIAVKMMGSGPSATETHDGVSITVADSVFDDTVVRGGKRSRWLHSSLVVGSPTCCATAQIAWS